MSLGKKEVIVFSVMALSNLLLKLCISITKINVTFLNRFLLPSKISPPVLAIAFFQFLNLKMYQTHSEDQKISISGDNALPTVDPGEKEKQMFNERQKYVGELPKITVVKLCYRRNPDDRKLILNSQKEFKEVAIELVQFIELF